MAVLLTTLAGVLGLWVLKIVLTTLLLPPGWRPHPDAIRSWDAEPFHG